MASSLISSSERVNELRKIAGRIMEIGEAEKSSSDAKYSLNNAYSYVISAANAIEKLMTPTKKNAPFTRHTLGGA